MHNFSVKMKSKNFNNGAYIHIEHPLYGTIQATVDISAKSKLSHKGEKFINHLDNISSTAILNKKRSASLSYVDINKYMCLFVFITRPEAKLVI